MTEEVVTVMKLQRVFLEQLIKDLNVFWHLQPICKQCTKSLFSTTCSINYHILIDVNNKTVYGKSNKYNI